jgi:hypothetical protein
METDQKRISYNFDRQPKNIARNQVLFAAALVLGCVFTATPAAAQAIKSPTTPAIITPPAGSSAFLLGRATGTQGYVCLPAGTGASWTVNAAHPEATLFTSFFGQDVQIITHFLSPNTNPNKFAPKPLPFGNATWQGSFDSSKVWAQTQQSIPAGSDASCPNAGSIGCLVLQVIGSEKGTTPGPGLLTSTTFIQRLNTIRPTTSSSAAVTSRFAVVACDPGCTREVGHFVCAPAHCRNRNGFSE